MRWPHLPRAPQDGVVVAIASSPGGGRRAHAIGAERAARGRDRAAAGARARSARAIGIGAEREARRWHEPTRCPLRALRCPVRRLR